MWYHKCHTKVNIKPTFKLISLYKTIKLNTDLAFKIILHFRSPALQETSSLP